MSHADHSPASSDHHDHHDHDNHHHTHDCHCGHDHAAGSKHIYVYAPSGAVRDKAAFARGVRRLQALGHTVEVDADALARHQRFAGDDATRLAAIHRAAASGADVALMARGGYGLTRLLSVIDYAAVARAVASGTQFVGMSDFTALQMALLAQTGVVSWAGPLLCADFGARDGVDEICQAFFDDLLCGQGEGAGWRLPKERGAATAQPDDVEVPDGAVLWGGNLAVLVSLLGTPYFPQIDGGILFLEDVGEHPYRIERMLTQLLHAGVLARQKAVVLGRFTEYRLGGHDAGFKLQTVVDWLRGQVACPVLTGLPFGHVPTKVLLPVGAPVSLSVEGRDALIYWGHIN
ncbi:Murein tetrapeptide carboxypeptidase [uncultured Comamonas sp.]|nr:Murein tetrapeptide carboxypeptidase [uncultured Comamonas sp.]